MTIHEFIEENRAAMVSDIIDLVTSQLFILKMPTADNHLAKKWIGV